RGHGQIPQSGQCRTAPPCASAAIPFPPRSPHRCLDSSSRKHYPARRARMNWLKRIFRRVAAVGAAVSLGSAMPGLATPEALAPAASEERAGPALWIVADDDTTIYIFGTVHALPEKLEWMDETIADALGSSDELVTEIDLADTADAGAAIASLAMLPEGRNLRDMLGPEDRKAYE